jgi:ABC-type transport system substrate-binding protein
MPQDPSFAYSLSQSEDGWRWSVYDKDGVTVADGAHLTRDAAEAAVELTLRNPPPELRSFG